MNTLENHVVNGKFHTNSCISQRHLLLVGGSIRWLHGDSSLPSGLAGWGVFGWPTTYSTLGHFCLGLVASRWGWRWRCGKDVSWSCQGAMENQYPMIARKNSSEVEPGIRNRAFSWLWGVFLGGNSWTCFCQSWDFRYEHLSKCLEFYTCIQN